MSEAEQPTERVFEVDLFESTRPQLAVTELDEDDLTETRLATLIQDAERNGYIGLAATYTINCSLLSLALSTSTRCIVIKFNVTANRRGSTVAPGGFGREVLLKEILSNATFTKAAFFMDSLSAALYLDFGIVITGGVDLSSTSAEERFSTQCYLDVLGGREALCSERVIDLFREDESPSTAVDDQCMQAWAAYTVLSRFSQDELLTMPKVDAHIFSEDVSVYIIACHDAQLIIILYDST